MADDRIAAVRALEVLDSRGNPTVEVELRLEDGSTGRAIVPSGASTGSHEAHELRDGDPKRYGGKGRARRGRQRQRRGRDAILGQLASDQQGLDRLLCASTARRTSRGSAPTRCSACRWRRRTRRPRPRASRCTPPGRRRAPTCCPCRCSTCSTAASTRPAAPTSRSSCSRRSASPTFGDALRAGSEVYQVAEEAPGRARPQHQRRRRGRLRAVAAATTSLRSSCWSRRSRPPATGPARTSRWPSTRRRSELYEDGKYNLASENRTLTSAEMVDLWAELVREVPHRQHRGRPGRGRLGGLGAAHGAPRRPRPARRRRPARDQHGASE